MIVLLVRPSYPQSRNDAYSIPISLCKLSAYHKNKGDTVYYTEGTVIKGDIPYDNIDIVHVVSLFTYWSGYTIETINFYKKLCKNAKVICGGIYASISPDHLKTNSMVDEVVVGVIHEVEKFYPDYSILPTDDTTINNTQIIWTSRGCSQRCPWCYTHIIEPDISIKSHEEIEKELYHDTSRKNIIFYDNSILQYPNIKRLMWTLRHFHKKYGYIYNACQGIDDRMLKAWEEKGIPVAQMMYDAGFYDLRFSYDHEGQKDSVFYCIDKFKDAGYQKKDMQIFVIINNIDSPKTIESRYFKLYQYGVQIHSDRFRPGKAFSDNYHKGGNDYFINTEKGWDNDKIRGLLAMMSDINYAVRMGCLYSEGSRLQKGKILNKGKSSRKIDEWNNE